jgi:hypothetical protein
MVGREDMEKTVRFWIFVYCMALLAVFWGCNVPKCLEVKPLEEIERDNIENIDDLLDNVDASDDQRRRIFALVRKLTPRLGTLRKRLDPKTHALLDEFRKPAPSRERILGLVVEVFDVLAAFTHNTIPILFEGHKIFTPEQLAKWIEENLEEKEPFEGSWLLDRCIDIFLIRIHASSAQHNLTIELKDEIIRQNVLLQKELARIRRTNVKEFSKANPNPEVVHASVDRAKENLVSFISNVVDYYLSWNANLEPDQQQVVHKYLRRLEPCEASKPETQNL